MNARKRRITARDIADQLGLSVMTVSRALSDQPNVREDTKKKVLKAAREIGYTPDHIAKSLVLRRTHTIGVVVPEITHSFFPEVIRGIEKVTYSAGYHLILAHSAEDVVREADAIRTLIAKRVDGILISTVQSVEDYSLYKQFIKRGEPIVFFDRVVRGLGAPCVCVDDKGSARRITEHLIEHGYRRIAHLGGPPKVSIGKSRLDGFREALRKANVPLPETYVVVSGFHESGGYDAMRQLLELPAAKRPEAVVAVNDPAAFGAIRAILEAGLRIPEDIAIVGFSDDIRAGLMATPLTTVRQPAYEIGRRAAIELIALIEGEERPRGEIIIKTEQVLRRSCGCPDLARGF